VARPLALNSFKPKKEALSCRKQRALEISRQNRLQPIESIKLSVHPMRWPEIQKSRLRQALLGVPALRHSAFAMVHNGVPRLIITAVTGVNSAKLELRLRYFRVSQSVWRVPKREIRHQDFS